MRRLSRKHKILAFLAIGVLGLLLAPFVAVQIQERIFRHRAEQLLADMRSLMMHKADLTEVQRLFNRWNTDANPCDAQSCWFRADLIPFFEPIARIWPWPYLRFFRMFGGRPAFVHAEASVEHGNLSHISYQVRVEISSDRDVGELDPENMLSGLTSYVSRFFILSDWQGLTLHPNYLIEVRPPRRGDIAPTAVDAAFGPHANPADIARLMTFNLSCLTRRAPCREPGDLMPEVTAQFAKEEPQLAQARKDHLCGPNIVGLMARDADYANVVEVKESSTRDLFSQRQIPVATVRVIENIAPPTHRELGERLYLEVFDADPNRIVDTFPPEVHVGRRFIVLAISGEGYPLVKADRCGILPLNPANLEFVKQAIAETLPPAKP